MWIRADHLAVQRWLRGWRALLLIMLALAGALQFATSRSGEGEGDRIDASATRSLLPTEAEIVGEESVGCGKFGPSCFMTYFALPGLSAEAGAAAVKEEAEAGGWTLQSSEDGGRGVTLDFVRGDLEADVVLWRDAASRCREHLLSECSTTVDHVEVGPRL
jgi:hypothetical protein